MKVIQGNIWDYHREYTVGGIHPYVPYDYIVIPTNGVVKPNGENVMGAGLAKQVRERYPDRAWHLGDLIKERGNNVYFFGVNLISFPVKHHWKKNADLELIEKSAKQLSELVIGSVSRTYLPKVGCGNGKLNWEDVEPILDKYLNNSDNFIVVDFK